MTGKRMHPPPGAAIQTPLNPALHRAFMEVNPNYFAWPIEEQERYRARMPEEDKFQIRRIVFKELFGVQVESEEELWRAFKASADEQQHAFNRTMLPALGVGEDCFLLSEYLPEHQTILDFETLYDYDYNGYCFQVQWRKEQTPEYDAKPYRGYLYLIWARLLIDGEFHYATLSMAAVHVYLKIEEFGDKKIANLMPHRYVNAKDHGKRESGGVIFNRRISAGGKGALVEELQRRFSGYCMERLEALRTEFDEGARTAVYMQDLSSENDPKVNFYFSDQTALRAVRLRHFMSDCRARLAGYEELDAIVHRERQAAGEYLDSACADVLANFDPKVVTFRKKTKIIIADGALDGLC